MGPKSRKSTFLLIPVTVRTEFFPCSCGAFRPNQIIASRGVPFYRRLIAVDAGAFVIGFEQGKAWAVINSERPN
jgi:hypothetical protein